MLFGELVPVFRQENTVPNQRVHCADAEGEESRSITLESF